MVMSATLSLSCRRQWRSTILINATLSLSCTLQRRSTIMMDEMLSLFETGMGSVCDGNGRNTDIVFYTVVTLGHCVQYH